METIELLKEEHDNIKRVLVVMRKLSVKILNTGQVDFTAFDQAIDFVRNYADKHHHGKEEDILFEKMSAELDPDVEEGPIEAMFSEHDLGRYFINNLDTALQQVKDGEENAKVDVIANAVAYSDFLDGHIFKEDNIVYNYGREELSEAALKEVKQGANEVEQEATKEGVQEKYIDLIDKLEAKVKDINLS